MPWNDNLQGPGLEIAGSHARRLRVMAGPGTGKSFCMNRRVARLLDEEFIDPRRILAVTFTRNAARSLVDDLHSLNVEGCQEIRVGTLHAFCFWLLGRDDVWAQLGRVARPLITFAQSGVLQFEAEPMLADLQREPGFGRGRACTARIRSFEAAWARLQSEEPGWPTNAVDRRFHTALVEWLVFHHAMLIGELVPVALGFMRINPNHVVLEQFQHIIVDEYQDLNKAEQTVIELLAARGSLAVVGDEDQSIYRFRHAHPDGIREFGAAAPTEDVQLTACRRCPTRVVAMANHLIQQNHRDEEARLLPDPTNRDGEIHIVQWDSLQQEREGLADFISYLTEDRLYSFGDIVVLSPRRLFGYGVRDALRAREIPAHSFYQEEPIVSEAAQESFALLTLLVERDDRVALRWWLGLGSPSWQGRQYARLRAYCADAGMSPLEALGEEVAGAARVPGGVPALKERYEELLVRLQALEGLTCGELLDALYPAGEEWAEGMREVGELGLDRLDDERNVGGLLDHLRSNITQPEMPEKGDFVRVMSLHKSKGLTSAVVIITSCIDGVIPRDDARLPAPERAAALMEQRRLFYVGVTRCREILVLSSVTELERVDAHKVQARIGRGRGRGATVPTIASRFMGELGPNAPDAQRGAEWLRQFE